MNEGQQILDSVRRLVRVLRLSERGAQSEVGLSGAQLFVLQELGRAPAMSLNELAERTRTDQSSVSVVVTRLVDAGLVARERSLADARRSEISITRRGATALKKAPPVAQHLLLEACEALPEEERKQFAATFIRLLEKMGVADAPAPMLFEDDRPAAAPETAPRRAAASESRR
jgi:DNA-binding MarR family transcriptional regulator